MSINYTDRKPESAGRAGKAREAVRRMAVRYAVFVTGLYFLAMGIVLIVRSTLGTSPISSINYVLSLNTSLSLGTCTFLINIALIFGQFWLIRGRGSRKDVMEILLQIPFSFLFAAFIDFNMALTSSLSPRYYAVSIALLIVGCIVQATGVVLEIKPRVAMMSAEGFVRYASERYGKEFGRLKVGFDVTLVATAILLSLFFTHRIEGIREGTVVTAIATGYIVSFISTRLITRRNLTRLLGHTH